MKDCKMFLYEFFLVVLLRLRLSSAQLQYGLCSQVYQMNQYCMNQQPNAIASDKHTPHSYRGKVGPRGPPGRTPEIDYAKINATIKEFCGTQSHIFNEILKNQVKTSDRISELQRDLQNATKKIKILELKGWYKAGNGLYYKVFQKPTTKTDYATAITKCEEVGARLATVGLRDPEVRSEIVKLIERQNDHIWIGLDDRTQEGRFVWIDGVIATNANTDWIGGQPDNARGAEDCVHLHPSYSWKMNDSACSATLAFICEKTVSA